MAVMRKVNSVIFTIRSVMFATSKRPQFANDGAGAALRSLIGLWSESPAGREVLGHLPLELLSKE